MSKFKGIANIAKDKIKVNSPEILVGVGLVGMLSSTVMACKAAPKVNELIEKEKEIRRLESESEMTKLDILKLSWKPYLPAAISYCASAACILSANSINAKRNTTLLAAYKIGEKALAEYSEKVVEVIGEEKEREIRDAVSKDRIRKEEPSAVIFASKGDTLCYDTISGRYFKCDVDKLKAAVNDINFNLINDMYASVNDFYDLLDLEPIAAGCEMGWNIEDGKVDIYFSAQLTSSGEPCVVLNYENFPKSDFDRLA